MLISLQNLIHLYRRPTRFLVAVTIVFFLCPEAWTQDIVDAYFKTANNFRQKDDWEGLSDHLKSAPKEAYSDHRYACYQAYSSYGTRQLKSGDSWAQVCIAGLKRDNVDKQSIDAIVKSLTAMKRMATKPSKYISISPDNSKVISGGESVGSKGGSVGLGHGSSGK